MYTALTEDPFMQDTRSCAAAGASWVARRFIAGRGGGLTHLTKGKSGASLEAQVRPGLEKNLTARPVAGGEAEFRLGD